MPPQAAQLAYLATYTENIYTIKTSALENHTTQSPATLQHYHLRAQARTRARARASMGSHASAGSGLSRKLQQSMSLRVIFPLLFPCGCQLHFSILSSPRVIALLYN